jgi:hypothetical protein
MSRYAMPSSRLGLTYAFVMLDFLFIAFQNPRPVGVVRVNRLCLLTKN